MRRHALGVVGGSLLALGIWFASATDGRGQQGADPKDAIIKLAKDIQNKAGNAEKDAAQIAKNTDLEDIMHLFKPRAKGGLGVGAKPGAITPDEIDKKVNNMGKRALKPDQLTKQKADLLEMAQRIRAIAEVTGKKDAPKKAGTNPANWQKYVGEMKKGSEDLGKAVESGDPAKVKAAAGKLYDSCVECHGEFRD